MPRYRDEKEETALRSKAVEYVIKAREGELLTPEDIVRGAAVVYAYLLDGTVPPQVTT